MATDGMWTLTDEGEFILEEPYATQLKEAKMAATAAWTDATVGYLAERSVYDGEFLTNELLRRCTEEGMTPSEIVEEFILEALSGDL